MDVGMVIHDQTNTLTGLLAGVIQARQNSLKNTRPLNYKGRV